MNTFESFVERHQSQVHHVIACRLEGLKGKAIATGHFGFRWILQAKFGFL